MTFDELMLRNNSLTHSLTHSLNQTSAKVHCTECS